MMAMDKDEITRKHERDAEADLKRQQNALPAWHLRSTITGDLTALGVQENARAEDKLSNDDMLRGLGVAGRQVPQQQVINLVEDVKPVINPESDCTLSAHSQADSTRHDVSIFQYMTNITRRWQLQRPHPHKRPPLVSVPLVVLILVISPTTKKKIGNPILSTLTHSTTIGNGRDQEKMWAR